MLFAGLPICSDNGTSLRSRPGHGNFDDFITMEMVLGVFSARKILVGAAKLLGAVFGHHKTKCPRKLVGGDGRRRGMRWLFQVEAV